MRLRKERGALSFLLCSPRGASVELGALRHLDLGHHLTQSPRVRGQRVAVLFGQEHNFGADLAWV